jgi:hypothetical protein
MTNTPNDLGDTDQLMRNFSRAQKILRDWFEPGSPREEFKLDEMTALSLRYNLCRAAELDPRQSELLHPSKRPRTAIDDELSRITQLKRYRELIQLEFRRAVQLFYQLKVERQLEVAHEIAKQTQSSATTLATPGSGRSQGSNLGSIFGERSREPQSQPEL